MDASLGAARTLGFALGAAHEPDHVAAVGTLVSEQRRVRASCLLGAFWGLGHTTALLAAGAAVIVFRVAMPPSLERGLEMSVVLLSIGLGARASAASRPKASTTSTSPPAPATPSSAASPSAG